MKCVFLMSRRETTQNAIHTIRIFKLLFRNATKFLALFWKFSFHSRLFESIKIKVKIWKVVVFFHVVVIKCHWILEQRSFWFISNHFAFCKQQCRCCRCLGPTFALSCLERRKNYFKNSENTRFSKNGSESSPAKRRRRTQKLYEVNKISFLKLWGNFQSQITAMTAFLMSQNGV